MSGVPIVLFCIENGWHMTSDRHMPGGIHMPRGRHMTGDRHMTGGRHMTSDSLIAHIVLRLNRYS
ncbi:hypothetical protein C3V37_06250 [Peptostreptococcaceae bacterium oral taxon 929]|nr:hypothetical protein C3V37_06250 [Peptostreptococcaceae bacterium oral taxon 929]